MKSTQKERAKIYDKWHREVYQTDVDQSVGVQSVLHDSILKYLNISTDAKLKILDLACGKGLFLREIRSNSRSLDLYGTDISKVAIDGAKKIVDADLKVSDAENLPYGDNFFDRIVCLGGIEYFQDPVAGAKETSRVLKKDGYAIFMVPNLMFLGYVWLALRHGMMPTHGGSSGEKVYYDYNSERFFTYKGWKDVFENGNLSVVSVYPYSYFENTRFANPVLIWLYNKIFHKMIPFNLSYAFIFVCKKKN